MATPTLTPGFTVLSTCDATTGWSGTNTVDSEFYKQGTAALSAILRTVGLNARQFTWSGNLSNTHLRLWFAYAAPGAIATKANGGIRLHVVTTTGTLYWYLGGSDTYGGGWTMLTVDTSRAPDAGSGNLANVTAVGFTLNLVSAPRNATNTWFDYLVHGAGMTITGGASGDPITLADIYAADNAAGYGAVQRLNSVYFVSTNLTIGGSANTYFEDDNQILVFEDQPVNADLYKLEPLGSGTTSFKLRNSVIKSASQATRFDLLLNNAGLDVLEFSGNSVINADLIRFKAGQAATDNVFQGCNRIEPSTAGFSGNNINDSANTGGALLIVPNHNVSDCAFQGNSRATEIQTAGEYIFFALVFYGNGYDVHNTSGGAVAISATGGSNASTYLNTGGGSVTISNSKTKTFIGLPTGTEVRIRRGSHTLAHSQDVTGGSYAFPYNADGAPAKAQFTLPGYVFEDITFTLDSNDQTFPVTWAPDPSYSAT